MERGDKWINSLKIAIINNDLEKIELYSKREIPTFSSISEAKEALSLVNQAKKILEDKKNILAKQMQALKQAKKYSNQYTNTSTTNWKV